MSIITYIGNRFIRIYKGSFSRDVIRIATAGISLSIAVMILAIVIVKGFQLEVRNKVISFSGHIILKPYQIAASEEQIPLDFSRQDIQSLKTSIKGIISVQPVAQKSGIIKTEEQMEGCIFKGVNEDYYTGFVESSMTDGHFPKFHPDSISNDIIISRVTASRMKLNTGDDLRMYFLLPGEHQPRGRKFRITGIFDTGFEEFDKKFIFGDLRHLQTLNKWKENETGSVEIVIDNYNNIEKTSLEIINFLDYDIEVWNVRELHHDIFGWLDLLDMNVTVIIIIMLVVAMINIVTILLIRILEKTTAIGILKSMGASNTKIRNIFLYASMMILVKGMLIGNATGFILAFIQQKFKLFTLDRATYFVSAVPINFDWIYLLSINIIVFVAGVIVMVLPSMIISKIYPAETLRLK